MYSKDELSAKSVLQLKDLAKEIGVKIKSGDNKERLSIRFLMLWQRHQQTVLRKA